MKNLFLTLLLIVMYFSAFSQNPYYDATKIKGLLIGDSLTKDRVPQFIAIIKPYLSESIDTLPDMTIVATLYNEESKFHNPFFRDIIRDPSKILAAPKVKTSGIASSISSLGGLNVTTFTDQLSQFLIDRAKQELNIAFFNRLKKFFDQTPEIQVLFPKSTYALENLLSYEYPTMINTMRNAFYDDLQDVFFKIDDVFKLAKYRPFIEKFPEVILSLKTIQVIAEIDNERHPADILGDMKDIPEWKEYEDKLSAALYNFHSAMQVGYMFSQSTRFVSFDEPLILKEVDKNNRKYIIQLDSGIAEATQKTTYKIDTIQSHDLNELISRVSVTIRERVDKTKIGEVTYVEPFLKNIFGEEVATRIPVKTANNIEELVYEITKAIRKDSIKYQFNSYKIDRMIRHYDLNRAWITRQHINYLIQDSITFKIYLGLLYQEAKKDEIAFRIGELLKDVTLTKDTIFLRGSILKENTKIEVGSSLNGKTLDKDSTLGKDLIISSQSILKKGSEIKSGSKFLSDRFVYKYLEKHKNELYLLRDYLVELVELGEEVDKAFVEIREKQKAGVKIKNEELYSYINTGIDVIEYAVRVTSVFKEDLGIESYLKIARSGNAMYLNIVKEEYAAAVNDLIVILEAINNECKLNQKAITETNEIRGSHVKIIDSLRKASPNLSVEKGNLRRDKKSLKRQIEDYDLLASTTKILKYGTFMANIVTSDSAEEIRAAIEAAALPVGSYTIKRYSKLNVSLNAYLGGSFGCERLGVAPEGEKWAKILGVHAPVGITASHGIFCKGKYYGSGSVFLTLLDIGAVTQFRLQNSIDTTIKVKNPSDPADTVGTQTTSFEQLPKIKLENIFAPGAYLVYGFPSLPISIGGGIQYGPALREITIQQETKNNEQILNNTIKASAYSLRVFISVDLPLLNLYTKPR